LGESIVRVTYQSWWLALMAAALAAVPAGANEIVYRDDFSAATLGAEWSILNEVPANHSLTERPGFFRIDTQRGTLGENSTVNNILLREMTGNFILDARIEFDPRTASQFAGLTVYVDELHTVALGLAYASGDRGEFRGVVLLNVDGTTFSDSQRPGAFYNEDTVAEPNVVYLRLLRFEGQFVGALSPDGLTYTDIGSVTNNLPDDVSVGLVAANGDFAGCGTECDVTTPADFDYFQITLLDELPGGGTTVGPSGTASLTVTGPAEVSGGSSTDFAAIATDTDDVETDVSIVAEWRVSPSHVGTIAEGRFEAAEVTEVVQATLVATYTPDPNVPDDSFTAATVVRISPPRTGLPLCGSGLLAMMPLMVFGLCLRRGRH